MTNFQKCMEHLEHSKNQLFEEFPNNMDLTEALFIELHNFIGMDFDGVTENKIYRILINVIIEIVEKCFDNDASKSYMRSFFKKLDSQKFTNYISSSMPSKENDIAKTFARMVCFFVYQDPTSKKENRLEEVMSFLKAEM